MPGRYTDQVSVGHNDRESERDTDWVSGDTWTGSQEDTSIWIMETHKGQEDTDLNSEIT